MVITQLDITVVLVWLWCMYGSYTYVCMYVWLTVCMHIYLFMHINVNDECTFYDTCITVLLVQVLHTYYYVVTLPGSKYGHIFFIF